MEKLKKRSPDKQIMGIAHTQRGKLCHHLQEVPMEAKVGIKFGMEGGHKLVALTGSNDVTIHLCQYLTARGENLFNVWCTDEGHRNVVAQTHDLTLCVKTAQLPTIGVATYTGQDAPRRGESYRHKCRRQEVHSISPHAQVREGPTD